MQRRIYTSIHKPKLTSTLMSNYIIDNFERLLSANSRRAGVPA